MIIFDIKLKPVLIIIISTGLLAACSEQETPTNAPAPVVTIVSEDKVAQLQREAEAGDPDAQYNLAYHYEQGLGVAKDEARALELYRQAADQGHSAAQNNLKAMSTVK